MAGVNKNSSRGSATKAGGRQHSFSSDIRLVQSLNGGRYARVADPNGHRNVHYATTSPEFMEALRALSEAGLGDRVDREIRGLADANPDSPWGNIYRQVEEDNVLVSAGE